MAVTCPAAATRDGGIPLIFDDMPPVRAQFCPAYHVFLRHMATQERFPARWRSMRGPSNGSAGIRALDEALLLKIMGELDLEQR